MTHKKYNHHCKMLELQMKIIRYTFLGEFNESSLYEKRLRQLNFIKQFKHHKIIWKLS